jgi:tetratricopeptide (TPR) repeat protein
MLSDEEKLEHAWMACNVCVDGIKRKEAQSTTVQEIHDFGRIIGPHAKTCFEDWSGVLEASPDQDDVAWHILGQVCMTQGAIDQAIGCFRLSLSQQSNQMDVKDRIQTALSLSSLLQQTGQFQKSSEVLAAIDMTSIDQALGFKVALARASATAAQGQFDCAEDQYEMLEFEQEEALGPLDIATVGTVQKLASTLEQMGKREEAQALYRRVYISYQNIYGPNDRMTLDALDDLANSYKESLAIDEAETLYKQSIDVRTRALGPDHPETAYAIQNLAVIDDLRRRYADAKTKYRQALDIIAPTLGRAHPLYTTTLENMAFSSRLHGQSIAATPLPQPTSARSLSTSSRTKSVKIKEEALSREVTCRRAFEEAEKYYLDVLTIKKSARELYTEDQIVATGSKLAEMYENEKFFDDGRGVKMDMLRTMLRESRRRGTI